MLSDIQELYFFHRVREAAQFQLRFNELWEQEDAWGIRNWLIDIRVALQRAEQRSFINGCQGAAYDEKFVHFIVLFNVDQDYFECHEVMEELWLEEGPQYALPRACCRLQ